MHQKEHSNVIYLKPNKKKFSHLRWFALLVIFIIPMIYFIFKPTRYIVEEGILQENFTTEAMVIMTETTVRSPESGALISLIDEGERVRVGTPLFIISTNIKEKEELNKKINLLEQQISALEDEDRPTMNFSVLFRSIEDATRRLKLAVEKGELDKVVEIRAELERLTKEVETHQLQEDQNLETLGTTLATLKAKLSDIEVVIVSPEAGVVNFRFEELRYPNKLQDQNHQESNLAEGKAGEQNKASPKNIVVKAGQPVLNIIDNFSWQLVMEVPDAIKKGAYYDINLHDIDLEIRGQAIDVDEVKKTATFRTKMDLNDLIGAETVAASLRVKNHIGNIIPTKTIYEKDGTRGVYVMNSGKRIFQPIETLYEDGEKAVVDGLKTGDNLLHYRKGFF